MKTFEFFLRVFPKRVLSVLFVFSSFTVLSAQGVTDRHRISGNVTNQDGEPLIGASVVHVSGGMSGGVLTDSNGKYAIDVSKESVLRFSYVGHVSQDIKVNGLTSLNVQLLEDENLMDEVVVIGYATVKKIDLTGAVSQISGEEISKAPVSSVAEALQGRVPGLQISISDGQPGNDASFLIRGPGSLTQSSRPLFVIDGTPIDDFDPQTLNPADVESISILKDASSAAIYGSRAANGVILITSKKGKTGKPTVSFGASYGYQEILKKMKLMGAYDFVKLTSLLNPTDLVTKLYLDVEGGLDHYKNVEGVDLQDHVFRLAPIQNYDLSLRGGTDHTKYSFSLGHTNQDGIMVYTGFKRYTGRFTFDQFINSKFRFWLSGDFSSTRQQGTVVRSPGGYSESLMYRIWGYRPVPTPTEAFDDWVWSQGDEYAISAGEFRVNPLTELKNAHSFLNSKVFGVIGTITYRPRPDLFLQISGRERLNLTNQEDFYNELTARGMILNSIGGPYGKIANIVSNYWSNENVLTYSPKPINQHQFQLIGIQGISSFNYTSNGFSSGYLADPGLGLWGLDGGSAFAPIMLRWVSNRAWFASKAMYNYKSKYLIDANLRLDGTSKFKNKWGLFPSIGVSWNMDKENFMKRINYISTSKLRFSIGTTGNDNIMAYAYYPQINFRKRDAYPFNNTAVPGGTFVSTVGNPDLKWEVTQNMNLGYELGLLRNRIFLGIDLYKRSTDNLLLNTMLRPSSGFSSGVKNIGSMENKGIELELKTINISKKDFDWRTNFNITFNKNKIIFLEEGLRNLQTTATFQSGYNYPLYIQEVGQATGMMIGFVDDGLYQLNDFNEPTPGNYFLKPGTPTNGSPVPQPGYVKYKDLNNDGVINQYDMTIIGRGQPIHYGGILNTVRWKAFSISAFFEWSYGNNIYNANRHVFEGSGLPLLNQFASYSDSWDFDNQDSKNPRVVPLALGTRPWGYFTSKFVEDGSYLRFKTLSAEYEFPNIIRKSISAEKIVLTAELQNLFVWSRYSGMDPEVSTMHQVLSPGFDYSAYPRYRTYTLGIKVDF